MVNKYLAPENCKVINPPSVNPEVKVVMLESTLRRDSRLVLLQKQVGACMAAIGLTLTQLINEEKWDNKTYLQLLIDVGRLLANVHHSESVSRKELISINLNKDLKDTLSNTPINEFLFGTDLDSTIKAAKDLEKSGHQLKLIKKPIPAKVTTKTTPYRQKNQENFKSRFSQKYGARRSGHFSRAPVSSGQRQAAQYKFQKKRQERRGKGYHRTY